MRIATGKEKPAFGGVLEGGHDRVPRGGLVRNYLSLTAANALSQLLTFVTIVYLARTLGVERFGEVSFAQALIVYFRLVSDCGLEILGTRMVSLNRNRLIEHVGATMAARLLQTGLAALLLTATIGFIGV
ncbi:MAG: oligosaccharide flippase family protein, partial [Acidimicrobiia bacterium]